MQLYQTLKKQNQNRNSDSACNGHSQIGYDTLKATPIRNQTHISIQSNETSHFKLALDLNIDETDFMKTVSKGYRTFANKRDKAIIDNEVSTHDIDEICRLLESLL